MSAQSVARDESVSPARPAGWLWPGTRGLVALFIIWLFSRFIFDSMWNLVPDEAYYWVWSRHLAMSYLDHPPIIALMIRLGTLIMQETELGVRCLSGVITAGTVLIVASTAARLTGDKRAAAFAPLALLLNPMIAVTGTIATPDAPACFFQVAALAVMLRIFEPDGSTAGRWILFGIFFGLALDSKYTSVLLGLSIFLAIISSPEGRKQLATPWPWIAAAIAIAVFSPVICWNATHDWASFRFQLHHGTSGNESTPLRNLADYLGSQLVVCTPVLFGLIIAVIVTYVRRGEQPMPVRMLIFSAAVPLVFFAISALRRRVEGNWPMFAYLPGVLLVAKYLGENFTKPRVFWAETSIIVAAVMTIVLHAPSLVWKVAPSVQTPQWDHLYGWGELARLGVEPLRMDSPIFAADYEYASELSFYLPDKPDVFPLPDPTRKTAFNFFSPPDMQSSWRAVLVRRLPKGYEPPASWPALGLGYEYTMLSEFAQYNGKRQIRRSLIEVAQRPVTTRPASVPTTR
jgi:4-amino-4-deoxy-L-arabinose transferase-like glycosyltransferase